MDTLDNLKAFIASADAGSFSAAARQLALVPSVIAKRIDQLEWRIRAPLFTRSTRKLTLTDVGERYLPTVRQLVRQMDDTLAGMARAHGELEGHIRIKAPTTLSVLYLSAIFSEFLHTQPMISMDVVLADRSVNPIEEGFDIAIGALPELYGRVQSRPLCLMKRHLCAAPAYLERKGIPQQPADLLEHDCLVFTTSGARWEFQSAQGLVGIDVTSKLSTNDGAAICQAAIAGRGIAILPDYLAAPAMRSGQLKEILLPHTLPDIWLKALVPTERMALPRIRMLLDWLEQRLKLVPDLASEMSAV
ncbi:MAG: LysR family transcriptional regulator [Gammaproteobacteria bacterium]|nr:LysR family transcriptional regulator [Gammaproteobacteria bacterium]MBU0786297.1 LysR family transcriptional regulator [Gammaproteobacteria bacterium]MBU0814483.1 LysR family transcriptional regulator [Gammaproteobacteria bacterium]MBU1786674.1 LysR family transcriptional regulator [Gammaproteobacteria bacterium]